MTEYKKCIADVAAVRAATAVLADRAKVDADIEKSKELLDNMSLQLIPSLRTRVGKLLAKAREKDPNRQIYNETMCARIEELAADADQAFEAFEPETYYVEEGYRAWLIAKMASEGYKAALVSSTSDLAAREKDSRDLTRYSESDAWKELQKIRAVDYDEAYQRFRAREAAEQAVEDARRAEERQALRRWRSEAFAMGVEATVNDEVASVPPEIRTSWLRHVGSLLDAVASDPSQVGIRKLRNLHPAVLKDFGHPFAESVTDGHTRDAERARAAYTATERLLSLVGYEPSYSTTLLGPVGTGGGGWAVPATVPWSKYGERLLQLQEPIADQQPDEWLAWHARLQDLITAITMCEFTSG
jgi:hypothetical protein